MTFQDSLPGDPVEAVSSDRQSDVSEAPGTVLVPGVPVISI